MSCMSYLVCAGTIRLAVSVVIGSPSYDNTTAKRTGTYQIRHTAHKRLLLKMD